jgi:hypothetical protein
MKSGEFRVVDCGFLNFDAVQSRSGCQRFEETQRLHLQKTTTHIFTAGKPQIPFEFGVHSKKEANFIALTYIR